MEEKVHLKDSHFELYKDLHPTKNGDLNSTKKIQAGYHRDLIWICEKGHEWNCSPIRRLKGSTCFYCSGRKILPGFNDMLTLYPNELKKYWDYDKNGEIPNDISKTKFFWATCEQKHSWETNMSTVLRGRGCAYCSNRKLLVGYNDLATTHPDIAKNIHTNSEYQASEVTAGSEKKVLWNCPVDNRHIFLMAPYRITGGGRGCSVCGGKTVIKGVNDFASRYPEIFPLFDTEKNGLSLEEITFASNKKLWWIGKKCGHSFKKSAKRMVKETGCPYCTATNKKILTGWNDLESNYPTIASEWHPTKNGSLDPSEVTSHSGKSFWWQCSLNKSHEWNTTVHNRTGLKSGCPHCYHSVSKAEEELVEYIKSLGFSPIRDRKVLNGKEIDIYIPEANIAIEYNGVYWHSEAAGKDKWYHYNKWQECKTKGIYLMQIWEDDYKQNPELFKRILSHKLGLNNSNKISARKTHFSKIGRGSSQLFMEKHHIQGFHGSSSYYGLKDENNNIVSVMSVKYSPKTKELEISRFASSLLVQGGFSKLLKNILDEKKYENAKKVVSYSHNDHSDGGVYKVNGFNLKHQGTPGYFYLVNNQRQHRLNYSPKKFKEREDLLYAEGKTERELAQMNSLIRVWDSGSSLWVKEV